MVSDLVLLIPCLSKELNSIGHHALPYYLEKSCKKNFKSKENQEELKIVFDSKLMIRSLASVCFKLIKQIKVLGIDDNSDLDKLIFENTKLEKQIISNKSEIERQLTKLTVTKLENQKLHQKVQNLEKTINNYKIQQQTFQKRSQFTEKALKQAIKKRETQIFNLHKAIWKHFNLADQNYFPENFKFVELNQPDFSKLWFSMKHYKPKMREKALKKAVCIFYKNNKNLIEENFFLKTILLTTFNKITKAVKYMSDKLHLPKAEDSSIKVNDIFVNIIEFNECIYNRFLNEHLMVIRKVSELLDKANLQ